MKWKFKSFLDIIREKTSQRKGEKVMQFNEIFEKTKYAFEHDEVFELLYGEKGYAYQASMVPVSIPTHIDVIFDRGIYQCYNNSSSQEKQIIVEKITSALKKMIVSDNPIQVWWALAIAFCQKLNEKKYKTSDMSIADELLNELKKPLLVHKEKLETSKQYAGGSYSNGLWGDVLRYNALLQRYFNFALLG